MVTRIKNKGGRSNIVNHREGNCYRAKPEGRSLKLFLF